MSSETLDLVPTPPSSATHLQRLAARPCGSMCPQYPVLTLQLGIGSIGTLVSHHLRHATLSPISLIFRHANNIRNKRADDPSGKPPFSLAVQRGSTTSTSTGFDVEKTHNASHPIHAEHHTTPESPNNDIDSLIVCLKTVDTLPALQILSPRLSSASVITLLQNGMGVYDQLCRSVFPDPATRPHFILGSTTHGVTRTRTHGLVKHMTKPGEGAIKLGVVPDPGGQVDMNQWLWPGQNASAAPIITPPPSPALPLPSPHSRSLGNLHTTLNTLLSMSELSPTLLPMPHLHHQLLLKVAINAAINPLTSILGLGALPNGALLSTQPGYRLVRQTLDETSEILTAYIRSLSEPLPPAADVVRLFSPESLEKRTLAVIRNTYRNTSSMAADISQGNFTEIEHINGYLVSLAARLNVPAPTHKMLVEMTKYVAGLSHPLAKVHDRHRMALRGVRANVSDAATKVAQKEAEKEQRGAKGLALAESDVELRKKQLEVRELEAKARILEIRAAKKASKKSAAEAKQARWLEHQRREAAQRKKEGQEEAMSTEEDETEIRPSATNPGGQ